jgi:predicted 3-demethylubiquinone-9 3-methyltransferase (glyoxalase superfamily)
VVAITPEREEVARFYAATFPDSKVTAVHHAPSDFPGGKKGDALTVEFTVLGVPCLGLNGGPTFKHSEAFSFQIATENQEETDATGTRLSTTAARKASAVGARNVRYFSWFEREFLARQKLYRLSQSLL